MSTLIVIVFMKIWNQNIHCPSVNIQFVKTYSGIYLYTLLINYFS